VLYQSLGSIDQQAFRREIFSASLVESRWKAREFGGFVSRSRGSLGPRERSSGCWKERPMDAPLSARDPFIFLRFSTFQLSLVSLSINIKTGAQPPREGCFEEGGARFQAARAIPSSYR